MHSDRDGWRLFESIEGFHLVADPWLKRAGAPLAWRLVHRDSVRRYKAVPVASVPVPAAASSLFDARIRVVEKDMAVELLLDDPGTYYCTLVGLPGCGTAMNTDSFA